MYVNSPEEREIAKNCVAFCSALRCVEQQLRSEENSDAIIDGVLQAAAEFYGASRASIVEADWELGVGIITHEWCADGVEHQKDMLQYLEEEPIVHLVGGRFHWMAEEFPASDLSLRTALDENFVIIDITNPQHHEVIGEMDRFTVPMLLHDRAIYIHNATQYQVEKLDFQQKRAYIKQVDVDYYTDADLSVSLRVLDEFKNKGCLSFGEVLVSSLVTMFKKMKFDTHENIGYGEVNLPELEMHTTAAWMTLTDELFAGMEKEDAQGGMAGIAHALSMLAPLYLMCASWDIQVRYHVRDPYTDRPTLYLYDSITGGVGLADKAYDMMPVLLQRAKETIETCPCKNGCPSCIGVPSEHGKEAAVELLRRMIDEQFAG